MPRDESFTATTARLSAGVIVWTVHFGVIYGYTGLACARRFTENAALWLAAVPWVIGISTVAAAAALVPFIVPALRRRGALDFVTWTSAGVAALALLAIVLEGITFLWLPACV